MFDLLNKTAVITGGGSGIGLATVERLHAAGANVVIADLTDQRTLAQKVNGLFVETNVTIESDVKSLMEKAANKYGSIDIVVNNAGIVTESPLKYTTSEDMFENFNVNTMGVFYGMKHAVDYMGNGGSIVNVASTAGSKGVINFAAYSASKWAIIGLTKVAALEFGPNNIRVNSVCPSSVDTPQLRNQTGGEIEKMLVSTSAPLGKINQPEDVASLIHFLVAEDCPMVSGQSINIDGGASAGNSQGMSDVLMKNFMK